MSAIATTHGLLLVLVLPAIALSRRTTSDNPADWSALRTGFVLQWSTTIALLVFVAAISADVLAAFGGPGDDHLMDAMVAFILVGVFGLGTTLAARLFTSVPVDNAARTLAGLTTGRKLLVALSAGITEEVVLRGFLITQLQQLGASTAAAAAVALFLATLTHAARRSLGRLVLGIPLQAAFVFAFVITGNVVACIIAHVAYDTVVLLTTDSSDVPA